MAWNSGFKKKSAEKHQLSLPARVPDADVLAAKAADPRRYLESQGFEVKQDGQCHLSVRSGGEEVYRLTNTNGAWLYCDKHRSEGGDNIALVQSLEPSLTFAEAVYSLVSESLSISPPRAPVQRQAVIKERTPPRLPMQKPDDVLAGRFYLTGRGIDLETIKAAEAVGSVRYASGSVFFVGYDEKGAVQAVTKRAIQPGPDDLKRRDLMGSLKDYCQILPGDHCEVWIAEGGVTGLAIQTLAKRLNRPIPTVLISGGAGVMSFLERDCIQSILRAAGRVVIAAENDQKPGAQEDTDFAHEKQKLKIEAKTGRPVFVVKPADTELSDIADLNAMVLTVAALIDQKKSEFIW